MHRLPRFGVSALLATGMVLPVSAQGPSLEPAPALQVPANVLAGTPASAFTTVNGRALDSADRALPRHPVRLRDARNGRIVGARVSDDAGRFTFAPLDPGTYVLELIGGDAEILAASGLIAADAGETVAAVVRLPVRPTGFTGWLRSAAPTALVLATSAAATGVLAVTSTNDVSPDGTR